MFVSKSSSIPDGGADRRVLVGLADGGMLPCTRQTAGPVKSRRRGIEDEVQRTFLLSAGCKTAQGYLCAKPKPASAATERLLRRPASRKLPGRRRSAPTSIRRELDHCGKLGLQMIKAKKGEVSAQSQAIPTQMSEGWIAAVGDFFNNRNMSSQEVQRAHAPTA
ncbi:hypothetical protein [Rhizobium etli]|uniref:hypothetical protein n=1 Tax=Rhizobium etli TaxID=29449 RepID=UPI001FD036EA|nr:hypothetical protein [Rhizobium etli]